MASVVKRPRELLPFKHLKGQGSWVQCLLSTYIELHPSNGFDVFAMAHTKPASSRAITTAIDPWSSPRADQRAYL